MELMIVRHGQTVANSKNYYYGFTDSLLTEKGEEQAKAAGIFINRLDFKPDEIYVSELSRTHNTLELMGFDKEDAVVDPRINEQNMGIFECHTFQEIQEKFPTAFDEWNADFNNFRPQDGESHLELYQRVKNFMVDLIERKKDTDRKILIVTHGGVMRSMYSYLNGDNLDVFYNVFFNNVATMRTKYITDRLVINAIYSPVELMKIFAE